MQRSIRFDSLGRVDVAALALLACLMASGAAAQAVDWRWTEGAPGGGRYSPLVQIDRGNVATLRVAWTYRHGDVYDGGWLPDHINKGTAFEATPLMIDGRLIFSTPFNRVIALDAENGRELWTFDPRIDTARRFANMMINRGVAYWGGGGAGDLPCARRVFLGTIDARLIALDAATGRPCADFGTEGTIDLLAGLSPVVDAWEYNLTSPPTVVGDVVIVGSSIADTLRRVAPPGDVRAFDARSGRRLWTFHTIPHPACRRCEGAPRRCGAEERASRPLFLRQRSGRSLPEVAPSIRREVAMDVRHSLAYDNHCQRALAPNRGGFDAALFRPAQLVQRQGSHCAGREGNPV